LYDNIAKMIEDASTMGKMIVLLLLYSNNHNILPKYNMF
jgi:hypothetical protein